MAAASSPSLTSKFVSFFSPTNTTLTNSPSSLKTHLKFPTFSPSISLKPHKNGGSLVTKMATCNVQILVEENEPEERLINRFRREVSRAGIIQECKRRRFFENSQDYRKRKTREAARKLRTRRPRPRVLKPDNVETAKKELYNSDEDDWELPGGGLPY